MHILFAFHTRKHSNGVKIEPSKRIFSFEIFFRLPWDQQTSLGYFGETCYFVVVSLTYLTINGTFMLLFISMCLHDYAFYQMFQHFIRKWHESDANRNGAAFLCKLIRFHVSVKKWVWSTFWAFNQNLNVFFEFFFSWFLMSADVYSRIVMIQLLCSMIMMACAFFQLDLVSTNTPWFSPTFKMWVWSKWFFWTIYIYSNSRMWATKLALSSSSPRSVPPICICIATLANRPPTASREWPTVYMNASGKHYQLICKNIWFWWLKVLRSPFFTMDSEWPFWI